jgi:Tol biopolymer transport system component
VLVSLSPGQKLGPYEIVAAIGAGGMGEVYRARDPRLGRDVAIKVLPASFASDSDRLGRFEQEARAAAALNHPNILAVYDIGVDAGPAEAGHHVGTPYVVSELLEGGTLRERIAGLPVRKAIEYALQIARGLAAAHEKGIVHRDLKPDNVFVTDDGRVKILDFGLAKLTQAESAFPMGTAMPTVGAIDTQPGMVMGTMGYMSPEQVRGQPVDHRADIFAFGVVLYEMLAGRRAFERSTSADTIIAIVKEDPPDLPAAERHIPPGLERIVDRCLEKSPSARFQNAADLAFALDALSSHSDRTEIVRAALPAARGRSRAWLPWAVAAAFGLALAALSVVHLRETPPAAQPVQFQLRMPPGAVPVAPAAIEISPDGQQAVFGAVTDGLSALWVRPLSSVDARLLPGTEGATYPFWSPDSRTVAFFADGKLKKAPLAGGPPIVLCDAPGPMGGTWNRDGSVLFARAQGAGIQKVSSTGGAPVAVTKLENGEIGHRWPFLLPDGRHFLFLAIATPIDNSGELFVGSLDSSERTALGQKDSAAVYGSNHLLFSSNGVLMAQPFDAARRHVTGEPFPIAEQVETLGATRRAPISVSDAGVLGYRSGSVFATLTWVDRTGRVMGTVGERGNYLNLALSPDERRLAIAQGITATRNIDIWVIDLARPGTPTRLTTDPGMEFDPAWSHDGSQVIFSATRSGPLDLYRHAASGAGQDELVVQQRSSGPEYSRDGKFLAYTSINDVWVLPLSAGAKPYKLLETEFNEGDPAISPDGRWMAYFSNETGVSQIYVQSFPNGGNKQRISEAGGSEPRWNGNGTELFFLSPNGVLMAAGIDTANGFRVKAPQALFQTGITAAGNNHPYVVTKDGQRFLVTRNNDSDQSQVTITTNWLSAVRK